MGYLLKKYLVKMSSSNTMYKYILVLFFVPFFCGCNNNKCKNERFYCRDEKEIDTGKGLRFVKIYYNGELIEEYYSSKNYEKDSFYTDYVNGNKSYILEYENGLQNGIAITFYNNGDTQLVQHYTNDTLNGICYGFYANKKIKYKQVFRMGKCIHQLMVDSTQD